MLGEREQAVSSLLLACPSLDRAGGEKKKSNASAFGQNSTQKQAKHLPGTCCLSCRLQAAIQMMSKDEKAAPGRAGCPTPEQSSGGGIWTTAFPALPLPNLIFLEQG